MDCSRATEFKVAFSISVPLTYSGYVGSIPTGNVYFSLKNVKFQSLHIHKNLQEKNNNRYLDFTSGTVHVRYVNSRVKGPANTMTKNLNDSHDIVYPPFLHPLHHCEGAFIFFLSFLDLSLFFFLLNYILHWCVLFQKSEFKLHSLRSSRIYLKPALITMQLQLSGGWIFLQCIYIRS